VLSPAASSQSLPKLLHASGTPRGLPEGEYLRGRSSATPSPPPSPRYAPGQKAERSVLPTIASAAELGGGSGSKPRSGEAPPAGAEGDWAAAVARGEAWTKTEPFATLWALQQADAAAERAARR